MMRSVHLHGTLGKEFGRTYRFDADTIVDVIGALRANFPRFANSIRHGFYRVVVGKTVTNGMELDEAQLIGFNLGTRDVHIVPVTAGRKRGGLGKIVAGIALVGLSMVPGLAAPIFAGAAQGATWSGVVGTMGTSMLVAGVAAMIAPEMRASDTTESFTMTGPTSDLREGSIVPIAYGEVIVGGKMISGGISIEGANAAPDLPTTPVVLPDIWTRGFTDTVTGSAAEPITPGGSVPPE